jgi:FkbM family methyltransferase
MFQRRARHAGITTHAFFELVFGRAPNDDESARLTALFPNQSIANAADAHRLLLAFDAQSYPTAFAVRATSGNLRRLELDAFTLWIDAEDSAVSAVIESEHGWEWHVSDVLKTALHPGSTFVDVGANVGFHTFQAASIVGPTGSVIACEPSSENCRLLQLSKSENDAGHVVLLPFALDRSTGVRYLTSHVGTNAGLIPDTHDDLLAGRGTPVYATTLDDIAPPRIDVMKVDVEGAEFRVLEGGRKTLDRDRPLIIMEFSCEMVQRVSGVDPGDALQDVLDLGYRLSILDRERRGPIAVASAAALLADWGDPFRIEDLLLQPA